MQAKKNYKANLEKRRAIHIQVGLIIALSFVLVSLEWGTREEPLDEEYLIIASTTFEPDIVKTVREKPKEPREIPQLLIPIPLDEGEEPEDLDYSEMFDSENEGQGINFIWPDEEPEEPVPEPIDQAAVQFKPGFPGGEKAMMQWLYGNIKYPAECIEHGIEGRVIAKFTIGKFGKVCDVEIFRSVHPLLDAEVIRILNMMPDFSPAMQGTRLVPVYMHIPVVFDLR